MRFFEMLQFLGNYCWLRLALNLLPMTFEVLSNLVLCRVFSYFLLVCIIGALGMQNFNTCLDYVALPHLSLIKTCAPKIPRIKQVLQEPV